jgi:SAM-dependent methyltransferase
MISINKCPICNSQPNQKFPARIAPFIRNRINETKDPLIFLLKCSSCDFIFFNQRLDDQEMAKIYYNYRGFKYQKLRQKYEIFYTKELNDMLGKPQSGSKKDNLKKALREAKIDLNKITNILDYGGDRGQHIDQEIFVKQKKYLYDISKLEAVSGVEKIQTISKNQFDFIISKHVIEHVSYPMELMVKISSALKKDGYFYFELPFDSPLYAKNKSLLSKMVKSFFRLKNYTVQFSIIKSLIINIIPILFKLVKPKSKVNFLLHEHINFFNPKSVKKMLELAGLHLLYIDESQLQFSKVIFGIAKK